MVVISSLLILAGMFMMMLSPVLEHHTAHYTLVTLGRTLRQAFLVPTDHKPIEDLIQILDGIDKV